MKEIILFAILGLFFSPFGAAGAFLITYEEYKKHVAQKEAVRHGLQMAFFTFCVFVSLSIIAGFLFSKLFASQ